MYLFNSFRLSSHNIKPCADIYCNYSLAQWLLNIKVTRAGEQVGWSSVFGLTSNLDSIQVFGEAVEQGEGLVFRYQTQIVEYDSRVSFESLRFSAVVLGLMIFDCQGVKKFPKLHPNGFCL